MKKLIPLILLTALVGSFNLHANFLEDCDYTDYSDLTDKTILSIQDDKTILLEQDLLNGHTLKSIFSKCEGSLYTDNLISEEWIDENGKTFKMATNPTDTGFLEKIETSNKKNKEEIICETSDSKKIVITGGLYNVRINGVETDYYTEGTGSCRYEISTASYENSRLTFFPNDGCTSREYNPQTHRGKIRKSVLKSPLSYYDLFDGKNIAYCH